MRSKPLKPFCYRGCRCTPEHDEVGLYFGVGLSGTNRAGVARHFLRVTFPDGSWIRCANPREARRYIDGAIGAHGLPGPLTTFPPRWPGGLGC